MAALVSYASSDEEDEVENKEEAIVETTTSTEPSKDISNDHSKEEKTNGHAPVPAEPEGVSIGPSLPTVEDIGPAMGPALPTDLPLPEPTIYETDDATPLSPYSANRAMIRELTLPIVPNLDVPPSPPGSPIASTNAKFQHFLELKKKGVHFNAKLANSPALKNPSLMQKLMDFAGISEQEQYATTLPQEIWDPNGFPESVHREELAKSQKKILKMKEDEKVAGKRTAVDFVPATTASGENSRGGTPTGRSRVPAKSTSERMLAGLNGGRGSSTQVAGTKRKSRFDS